MVVGNNRPLPNVHGLRWGSDGPSASALAYALLAAEAGAGIAELHYLKFRDDIVTTWHADEPWSLHSLDIRRWLQQQITARKLLAQLTSHAVPLLTTRFHPWPDATGIDASWPDVLAVMSNGQLAFNASVVQTWQETDGLARMETPNGAVWSDMEPIHRLREWLPPTVPGCELRLLRYPAIGRDRRHTLPAMYDGCCLVRWRRWYSNDGTTAAVVVSELTGNLAAGIGLANDSTAITNRVEWIATALRAELDVVPERLIYIEHLPTRDKIPANFALVTGNWNDESELTNPQWTYLSREAAERLTGMVLDDTAVQDAWRRWPVTIRGV